MKTRSFTTLMLSLIATLTISTAAASNFVNGRIYFKDGSVVECGERDRIKLPKHSRPVKLMRNAYRKDETRETFAPELIDSMVCWHPSDTTHLRKFVFADKPGWMWVYLETPEIVAAVYAAKGYGISSNGGIEVLVKQRYFSRSRTAYLLRKKGDEEYFCVGSASRRAKKRFRRLVAGYIADDPLLASEVLESKSSNRSRVILMLNDYDPHRGLTVAE